MFLPELGKQIQGERDLSSNNRIIRISAGSNNREFTVAFSYLKWISLRVDKISRIEDQNFRVDLISRISLFFTLFLSYS